MRSPLPLPRALAVAALALAACAALPAFAATAQEPDASAAPTPAASAESTPGASAASPLPRTVGAPGATGAPTADDPCALAAEPCRAELARLRGELAAERAARAALERRLTAEYESRQVELERALREERERSLAREREWIAMTKALAVLELGSEPSTVVLPAGAEAPPPPEPDPEAARAAARDRELFHVLRSLLWVEEVRGLELLAAGRLHDGATGPVVFRMVDPRGRPFGTLVAERLRLEGSDAGRTLTLVLERGYERRSGRIVPFEGDSRAVLVGPPAATDTAAVDAERETDPALRRGVRRIALPFVDPAPWREAAPELFPARESEGPDVLDDGLYDKNLVRTVLNRLLRVDGVTGHWRLEALAGVKHGVLRDVQLVELDRAEEVLRRLFADRLHLVPLAEDGGGVLLLAESGVQVRDGRKAPFLDGRYRIFLPRADVATWRESGLPVLALEPAAEAEPALAPGAAPPGEESVESGGSRSPR